MSRRVKFATKEMGVVELLAIWEQSASGEWEHEWEPLRGTRVGHQFSRISQAVLTHALKKFFRPLVDTLGIPPAGALRKLAPENKLCLRRRTCPLYRGADCHPLSKAMPWCFEPDGITEESVRKATALAIECWREGVYIVVVTA